MSANVIDAHFIETFISAPTVDEKVSCLEAADLLNETGLNQLLAEGINMARSDPAKARQLSLACAAVAPAANAPAVVPRAVYLRAQAHAIDNELQTALQLINEAYNLYLDLDLELPALRTNVGKMHVLNELGRHQEALAAGDIALTRIQNAPPEETIFHSSEARLVVMLTHLNRGVCYRRIGQYEEALSAYMAAEDECLAGDIPQHLGDIRNNTGVTLMCLGRVTEALAAFEAAAAAYVAANHTRLYAFCMINTGEAHLLLGNYRASREALQLGRQQFERMQSPVDEHLLLMEGHVYLALNLHLEALAAYQEAERSFQAAGMTHFQGQALWGIGAASIAQNQFEQAESALQEAARLFAAAENLPLQASVLLEQAALQMARGEQAAARETARRAANLLMDKAYPVEQIYAHLRLADLAWPDLTAVEDYLLTAKRLSKELALPHLDYRVQQRMGRLRRRQGQPEEARRHLETAVAAIERLRGNVAQEAMRVSFLYDKMAAYEELLQLHLESGQAREAFAVAEQAKSRALVDLLTGVLQPPPPLPDDQANQLQQLQADLNALYSEFLGGKSGREPASAPSDLQARAQELERGINRLRLQTVAPSSIDPFAAALSMPDIEAQLSPDAILLAYHVNGDEIMAFARYAGETTAVRHLCQTGRVQQLLQRLAVQWDRFRAGPDFAQRHIAQLEQSARRILADLYKALIAPVAHLLPEPAEGEQARRLFIIPHGLLHQTPFHALYDGQHYLLERFEIGYAPSATILALCQRQTTPPAQKAVLVGVADPLIPAVAVELAAVTEQTSQRFSEMIVYQNEMAVKESVQRESAGAALLHLACHGLFRADNPMFSALKLHDGWLTAVDILQFNLAGALVILSACESGRSQVMHGDELLGLTRAFLGAGAASLLVSLWLVQDETTAHLMGDWYAQFNQPKPERRAAALRSAQLALKATHPHPYYWAPFILIGQN